MNNPYAQSHHSMAGEHNAVHPQSRERFLDFDPVQYDQRQEIHQPRISIPSLLEAPANSAHVHD